MSSFPETETVYQLVQSFTLKIEPDQCLPGVPKWVALLQLTVKHLEALLKMAPTLTTLNEQ